VKYVKTKDAEPLYNYFIMYNLLRAVMGSG
jgi:hypothetical protein